MSRTEKQKENYYCFELLWKVLVDENITNFVRRQARTLSRGYWKNMD